MKSLTEIDFSHFLTEIGQEVNQIKQKDFEKWAKEKYFQFLKMGNLTFSNKEFAFYWQILLSASKTAFLVDEIFFARMCAELNNRDVYLKLKSFFALSKKCEVENNGKFRAFFQLIALIALAKGFHQTIIKLHNVSQLRKGTQDCLRTLANLNLDKYPCEAFNQIFLEMDLSFAFAIPFEINYQGEKVKANKSDFSAIMLLLENRKTLSAFSVENLREKISLDFALQEVKMLFLFEEEKRDIAFELINSQKEVGQEVTLLEERLKIFFNKEKFLAAVLLIKLLFSISFFRKANIEELKGVLEEIGKTEESKKMKIFDIFIDNA